MLRNSSTQKTNKISQTINFLIVLCVWCGGYPPKKKTQREINECHVIKFLLNPAFFCKQVIMKLKRTSFHWLYV